MTRGGKKGRVKKGTPRSPEPQLSEGDVEARIHNALLDCFPHLSGADLEHQRTFVIRVGRTNIKVEGSVRGRLDILVRYRGQPLAILEIKNPGNALTDEDRDQGISYACLITPKAPLVVVTNGVSTRLYNSFTAEEWKPTNLDDKLLSEAIRAATSVADDRLDDAVKTLLGTNPAIWQAIVRRHTQHALSELSGDWDDFTVPFVNGFRIPRKATAAVLALLSKGERLILLTGPPLSGKTNVLGELATLLQSSQESHCPLYVEGSSCQQGILQAIATVLGSELFVRPNVDSVRNWLLRLMGTTGHGRLIILVDDIPPGQAARFRADIDELLSFMTGTSVALVIAVSEYTHEQMSVVPARRQQTRFGRRARVLPLTHLDHEEFDDAMEVFAGAKQIRFWDGVAFCTELHWPRYMRVLGASAITSEQFTKAAAEGLGLMLPSVTGPELVFLTREHWAQSLEVRSSYRRMARVMLKESDSPDKDPHLIMRRLAIGAMSENALRAEFEPEELRELSASGHVKIVDGPHGHLFGIPALPELVISELSHLFAEVLGEELAAHGASDAAGFLMRRTSSFPLHDVLGACVLCDLASLGTGLPFELVEELLSMPPTKRPVDGATKAMTHVPGVGDVLVDLSSDGEATFTHPNGTVEKVSLQRQDWPKVIDRYQPYLVLAQLARITFQVTRGEDESELPPFWLNFHILEKVGSCRIAMPRVNASAPDLMLGFKSHDLGERGELACHLNGIVEPVTAAMCEIGRKCPDVLTELTQLGCKENRLSLVNRLNTALEPLMGDPASAEMAAELRTKWLLPKLAEFGASH